MADATGKSSAMQNIEARGESLAQLQKEEDYKSSNNQEDVSFEVEANISDDDSDEVSLMVVDEEELANAMQEAGISIRVSSA